MKRLTGLLVSIAAASSLLFAQTPQPAQKTPAAQPASTKSTPAKVDPTSLVGLTKLQVEAKLGKPGVAMASVWSYKQPNGTLRVRFDKDGKVSDSQLEPDVSTT